MVLDEGGPLTFRVFVLYIAIPYLIGFYYSKHNLEFVRDKMNDMTTFLETLYSAVQVEDEPLRYSQASSDTCLNRLLVTMHNGRHVKRHDKPFENMTIVMHRNGEAEPCGKTTMDIIEGLRQLLQEEGRCPLHFEKYQLEALLTRLFHRLLKEQGSCHSADDTAQHDFGFYGYCDRGEERTPILPDHESLVSIEQADGSMTLPCHFHSAHGIRVDSLPMFAQLARVIKTPSSDDTDSQTQPACTSGDGDEANGECRPADERPILYSRELHLYAVPAGRIFMFAVEHVGQIIPLPHLQGADPEQPVHLQVLSTHPRIFDIVNFFDRGDSDDLIEAALSETRDAYRIKRSSTGIGYNVFNKRTSESGFDTNGPVAAKLKRRGMSLLGFDKYVESFTDGLQILRYNETTAYTSHLDWMDPSKDSDHDYDASGVGGNRFATILLYMSDLAIDEDAGGETVFPLVPLATQNERKSQVKAGYHHQRKAWFRGCLLTLMAFYNTIFFFSPGH